MSATASKPRPPLRDRIIPWYFVMGFMVVLAVNVYFVRTAIRTNPGVVTEHAYEKGLAYNDTIAAVRAQRALGWQGDVTYADGTLRFTLRARDGAPLTHARVTAYIDRPLQPGMAQEVTLEETGNGVYATPLALPKRGQWDITVNAIWNDHSHQTRRRVTIP